VRKEAAWRVEEAMASSRARCLIILVGLGACQHAGSDGPGGAGVGPVAVSPASPLQTRSGSRLKAHWRVSADGARTFAGGEWGWNGACHFTARQGDTFICVSPSDYPRPEGISLFADAGCTQPVISQHSLVSKNPVFELLMPNRCPLEAGIFQPDPDAPPLEHVFQSDGQRCWEKTDAAATPYRAAKELRGGLVIARLVPGPARDGWAPQTLEGDDGAREFYGWKNVAEGYTCFFGRTADGVMRCLPGDASVGSYGGDQFADPQCQTPAATAFISGCAQAAYVSVGAECAGGEVHRGGARIPAAYHHDSQGKCAPAPPTNLAAFAVGPVVPPGQFPEVKYAPGAGTTRLRPVYVVGMPEPTPVSGFLWDTALQTRCDASGERCYPAPAPLTFVGHFSDSACTQNLVADDGPCTLDARFVRASPFAGAAADPSSGAPLSDVYRLGAPYSGPVFGFADGPCALDEKAKGHKFRRAERLREDAFVTVTDAVDP
jgi:hypothetical protein